VAPERGGGGRDGRARHDDDHRRPSLGRDAGERSFVVTLSSQMNAPAAGRSSSPSTAPNGRHVVILRVAQQAWAAVRRNNGAPGIDATTLADVEEYGVDWLLDELAEDLRNGRWLAAG
jgi:hypothetical protein